LIPEGLRYEPSFVEEAEERELIAAIDRETFSAIRMHGVEARRRAIHYGLSYNFDRAQVQPGPPFPDYLLNLRARAAAFADLHEDQLAEALVLQYPPGATIGWHRDAPPFGIVIGISLRSACRLRFRRGRVRAWETSEMILPPRSLYLLSGPARAQWQHSIPAVKELRYSITFRTLRRQTLSGTT
jgi:alkylated DNA repair protein (DNA oxidative demethylase)